MIINSRICAIRKHFGLTQEEFGKKLGFSNVYVCKMETTSRKLSSNQIIKICKTFNVTSDWLLGLSDEGGYEQSINDWYKPYKTKRRRRKTKGYNET